MYITVKITEKINYANNDIQRNGIFKNVEDSIRKFFAAYCTVGADIRVNALIAALNNSLSGYGVSDIDVDIANTVQVNKNNIISIGNTQRAFPNKILTSIEYVGGE